MINEGDIVDGKYRVTRILGTGGMGMVVEAYHATLDMFVAIKFMRPGLVVASGGPARFLREARALVKLKSQHAVKVHDLGVRNGSPYIVMEHLEGMDMESMLNKEGPLGAGDAARHIRQACEAIAEAHSLGIYHRDLKPANLFLARGAPGKVIVKVLDFGIAKMIRPPEDDVSGRRSLTGSNILMGTLPYMSPEQLMAPKEIDQRADIWSLGVVLYELVTGDLPFQGNDLYEVQNAIRFQPFALDDVPQSLQPIIRRCLEKKREDRYASAEDLAISLRRIVNEPASPPTANIPELSLHAPQGVVIRSATTPIPRTKPIGDLTLIDSLPPMMETNSATSSNEPLLPAGNAVEEPDTVRMPVNPPTRETAITRLEKPTLATGKRRSSHRPAAGMQTLPSQASPVRPGSSPSKRHASAQWKEHVVPVRRTVLVVKQPIQMSRRRRNPTRLGRFVVGALAIVAILIGFDLYRQRFANAALPIPSGTTTTNR